ncbi:MAG TPA: VOC family protein [Solirubrobacteraceae bacterium]|nr:VOC family protein [Solirubrobacteraceae bacterium]
MELFAGMRVRDLEAARGFYDRLFGSAPAFFPNDEEAVWEVAEHRYVYALVDPARAGDGLVTLFAEDLDAVAAEISGRGLEPAERETYDNGVRKLVYRDPDGNELGIGGGPAG